MTRYFQQGQQEAAYRERSAKASMAGISLCATFMCKACGMKKTTPGRKPVVKGYSRAGYRCAECVALSAAKTADKQSPASQSANSRLGFQIQVTVCNKNNQLGK